MIKLHISGIVFTMMPQCPQFLEKVAKKYPVIVIGDKTTDIDLNVIETSNYTAGVLMAEHLYELGHRNIAFLTTTIGKSLSLAMRYQRLKAIQNTYKKLCMNEPYNIIVKEAKIDPELERKNIFLEHGVGYQLCNECLDDEISQILLHSSVTTIWFLMGSWMRSLKKAIKFPMILVYVDLTMTLLPVCFQSH